MADARPMLMNHQTTGVEFQGGNPGVYLCCDRGTGKTAMVLVNASHLVETRKVERILYVAPLSTLENIRREIRRFTTNLRGQVVVGPRAQRVRKIQNPGTFNVDIINFDALRIMAKELMEANYDMIVIDEATRIKARSTQTARVAIVLGAKAKYKRCLSGMPFTEGVEDLWSQFAFLDPGVFSDNYYAFVARYCVFQERMNWKTKRKYRMITGYRNMEELEKKVGPLTYRVDKKDCLDLPPKTFQILRIPMLAEQAKHYAKIEHEVASEIGDRTITHSFALAKLSKCRQIAAGFLYDDDHDPIYVPTMKYQELQKLLEETLYGTGKVVIFTTFRAEPAMVRATVEALKKKTKVFQLPADPLGRQPEIDQWAAWDKSPAVLLANTRSGGIGLNLTAAHLAVFMSNDYRMEDRVQAEDRLHRIGSEIHSKITIVDILTEGTVEEDVLEALKTKQKVVDVFLKRIKENAR